jgi:hypothetical protein
MVEITSEIGKGASGMKHGGTLEAEIPGSVPVDVVVILAFNEEQQDILEHEYEVLGRLRSEGVLSGVTTAFGLFEDIEDDTYALVMLDAGDSLASQPERVLSASEW